MVKVVYFAGPLFTQAEREWNAAIAADLSARGFEVILPQHRAKALIREGEPLPVGELFEDAIAGVSRADAVVAVLDGPDPDSGTCFECGYAHAIGRPIVGVRTDLRLGGDDASYSVNLKLSRACRRYIRVTAEELQKTTRDVGAELAEVLAEL